MRTRVARASATTKRFPRALCLATAGMAFLLGAVVGVLLPFYVLVPALDASSNTSAKVIPTSVSEWRRSGVDVGLNAVNASQPSKRATSVMNDSYLLAKSSPSGFETHTMLHKLALDTPSNALPVDNEISSSAGSDQRLPNWLVRLRGSEERKSTVVRQQIDGHAPISAAVGPASARGDRRRLPTETALTSQAAFTVASPWHGVKDDTSQTPVVPDQGIAKLVDGIFWAGEMEQLVPRGFSAHDDEAWREFVNTSLVLKIEEGCGRMQNRLLTFDGGNESCCRYRQNNDQIQGEIFSFYLSRILGIGNLPPAVLGIVRGREWQWGNVWSQLHLAQWNSEKPVVLTKFVPDLEPALIPTVFRNTNRRLHPIPDDLAGKNESELIELVQWSDLIVFDYLTANLDRVVNNMFNQQWNAAMMRSPAHNLAVSSKTGLLVFLDNESGLLHGYRLLDKYDHFHRALLDSLCIFRKSTADSIVRLYRAANIGQLLRQFFRRADPGMEEWLPFIPDRHLKTLSDRIADVYRRIRTCQAQYGPLISS